MKIFNTIFNNRIGTISYFNIDKNEKIILESCIIKNPDSTFWINFTL